MNFASAFKKTGNSPLLNVNWREALEVVRWNTWYDHFLRIEGDLGKAFYEDLMHSWE